MALTGIEIFKMLPKTNCKECGFPTCLAFAMALASGKAELDKCPYVSEEAKEKLAAASAPPIRPVKIGPKDAGQDHRRRDRAVPPREDLLQPHHHLRPGHHGHVRRRSGCPAEAVHGPAVRAGGPESPSRDDLRHR